MASDPSEASTPVTGQTDSPMDDSDESTQSELTPIVYRFISGQIAQSYNVYNSHLPYASSLQSEAVNYLKEIKANLGKLILLSAHKSDIIIEIRHYIGLYGHYFTKEDHILFIKLHFQLMQIPGIELTVLNGIVFILLSLLRKQRLISPKELTIEWRPLFDIYIKYIFERKGLFQMGQSYGFEANLRSLIEISRNYFSIEATQEILDELRPVQCPFTSCKIFRCAFLLGLFLPTQMFPENHDKGFKLWFDEMIQLWSGPNAIQYENIFFKLLSRLAAHNIGYIDWSPHMANIFTKYTKAMNISVNHSALVILSVTTDSYPLVNWIVSMIGGPQSKALEFIEALFKTVESNFHPSNMSRWNAQLTGVLAKLSSAFVTRVNRERNPKKTWEFTTPKEYHITEEEIDKFVDILMPILLTAMFSRFGTSSIFASIRDIAFLRPEKVIPPLVEQLYIALETNQEAHRINSLMSALSMVAPTMVNGYDRYEEGKTHLISLLFASLPGLDCNDIKKCGNTCRLICHLVDCVPIMDCSKMVDIRDDLSAADYNIALETVRFEEFVLVFLEKLLLLVENYGPEQRPEKIDNEPVRQSSDESYFEDSISGALSIVLTYSSPPIFERALDKLFIFLRGRLFESKSTIRMMANICRVFAETHAKLVHEKFLPYLHSTILGLTDNEDIFEDESVDQQLTLALHITNEIIVKGDYMDPEKLLDIVRRGLKLKSSSGYKPATGVLRNMLFTLTSICPNVDTYLTLPWDQLSDFTKVNPIRLWGKHDKLNDIKIDWFVPSEKEILLAQKILDEFLLGELNNLKEWISGRRTLAREEVHRSLYVIFGCISGTWTVLPPFDSEEYIILDSVVPPMDERVHEIGTKIVYLSSGANPRQLVAESTREILKHIMTNCDDDIKSLDIIIRIFKCLIGWVKTSSALKIERDYYMSMKKDLKNKLSLKKTLPRRIIIQRIILQHELRSSLKNWGKFTRLHRDIIQDYISLAFSYYADIRAKAQSCLSQFKHPYGYKLIASELTRVFKQPSPDDSTVQGALSILLGHHSSAFLVISDWECIVPLWLSLINTKYSEKPVIIALLEQLTKTASSKLQPLLIEFKIAPELYEIGKQMYTIGITPEIAAPDESAIENGRLQCERANQTNLDMYNSFVKKLAESIESGQLHWRHLKLAFLFLHALIRKDVPFPIEGTRVLVKNLLNDHVNIRRICITGVAALLKKNKPQVKFDYIKVNLNSDQPSDYDWLFIRPDVDYNDEKLWHETKWVNRSYISPNRAPKDGLKYYTEASAIPARNPDSVSAEESVILDFFRDKVKVTKLLDYISLDDKKTSLLGPKRYKIFQGIFSNFGVYLIDSFRTFIEEINSETKEYAHRCACDVLTGMVLGSKYWPYQDMITLRNFLEPFVKRIFKIVSRETNDIYCKWCVFGFRRQDGRRFSWLFRYLLEDPLCSNDTAATSLQSFCRLKVLGDILIGQCWRAIPYLRHLYDNLIKYHLKNPYQNIRQLVGVTLTQLLQFDHDFYLSIAKPLADAPNVNELLDFVLPGLEATANAFHSSGDQSDSPSSSSEAISNSPEDESRKKDLLNLVTTLCCFIAPHLTLNPHIIRPQMLQLVSIICEVKNRFRDEELTSIATEALNSIGNSPINEKYIDDALDVCAKMAVSNSWHTRVSVITYIQFVVSSNLFLLRADTTRTKRIHELVMQLLQDGQLEVRKMTGILLSGLLHYKFIQVDRHLINRFKTKCARKLTRSTSNNSYDSNELSEKHGGAVGLCSIVNAYPYDVPEFLPDILMFLSAHLHDPQPIPTTIRNTLSDFKRTHHDNWRQHKEKFNEDQLEMLTDLLVSPNYYA